MVGTPDLRVTYGSYKNLPFLVIFHIIFIAQVVSSGNLWTIISMLLPIFVIMGILLGKQFLFQILVYGNEFFVRNSIGRRFQFHITQVTLLERYIQWHGDEISIEHIVLHLADGKKVKVDSRASGYREFFMIFWMNMDHEKMKMYERR